MQVTALRERPDGRVEIDVDGRPWRIVPAAVAVRTSLTPGLELDRRRLRAIARELRRGEALAAAAKVVSRRVVTARGLEERLERRGIAAGDRAVAVKAALRAGVVDDERYAVTCAVALAERDRGDAAIRWQLERDGVDGEVAERAVGALAPEAERAARVVARRGVGARTARYLAGRGFAAETVEAVLGANGPAALGYEDSTQH